MNQTWSKVIGLSGGRLTMQIPIFEILAILIIVLPILIIFILFYNTNQRIKKLESKIEQISKKDEK